jgi:hypothetical protein
MLSFILFYLLSVCLFFIFCSVFVVLYSLLSVAYSLVYSLFFILILSYVADLLSVYFYLYCLFSILCSLLSSFLVEKWRGCDCAKELKSECVIEVSADIRDMGQGIDRAKELGRRDWGRVLEIGPGCERGDGRDWARV